MATTLYKLNDDGSVSSKVVETKSVRRLQNSGWVGTRPKAETVKETPTVKGTGVKNTGNVNLSDDEIRALAKAKGISHYHVKGIETLKKELGI